MKKIALKIVEVIAIIMLLFTNYGFTLVYAAQEEFGGSMQDQTGTQFYNAGKSTNETTGAEFTAEENGYTYEGHDFDKWSDGDNAPVNYYEPGDTVTFNPSATNTNTIKNLYAEWYEIVATNLTLNKDTASMAYGDQTRIKAMLEPARVYNKQISWTVADPTVCTLNETTSVSDEELVITAIKPGTTTITATTTDGTNISKTCTVTVTAYEIAVVWDAQDTWDYNARPHAPSISNNPVEGPFGEIVSLEVTGMQTDPGTYTATAQITAVTNGNEDASNYTLTNTTKQFTIEQSISGAAQVTGTTTVGQVLTASMSELDPADATLTYQWYRSDTESTTGGTAISGATGTTYTLTSNDENKYIYVVITAKKDNKQKEFSAVTGPIKGIYTITLDNESATEPGTTAIYEHYNVKYSLTNETNGAEMTTSENPITAPTKAGYTFTGYYTAQNGEGEQLIGANGLLTENAGNTAFEANGTLYANWVPATFTVTFNPVEGTVDPASKEVTYNEEYGELPIPEREGYTFAGWYTEANGQGSLITEGSTAAITANQTLYAYWSGNPYTVTFNPNGGAVDPTSKVVTYSEAYGELPTPQRAGHTFKGWLLGNEEYEPVEYIESTGTQFIDTGYSPTPSTGIEVTYQFTDLIQLQHVYSSVGNLNFALFEGQSGNLIYNYSSNKDTGIAADTNKHTFKFNVENNSWSMDGGNETTIFGSTTNTTLYNILIMAKEETTVRGATSNNAKMRLYGFKIYENGELVRNLIPCIRTADVRPGLYDSVNGTFYTNDGKGEFIIPSLACITSETIVTIPSNHTLIAQWEEDLTKIKYLGNGGTHLQNSNLIAKYDGTYNAGNTHNGTTTTWTDISGNGNDGAIADGTWGQDYLQFNGSSTWVNLGEMNSENITIETTLSINSLPEYGQYATLIGNKNSGGIRVELKWNGDLLVSLYTEGSQKLIPTFGFYVLNKPFNIAVTYDGESLKVYIDGELIKNEAISGTITTPINSTVMAMGAYKMGSNNPGGYFSGKIYNLAIYDTALSEEQIARDAGKELHYAVEYGVLPTPERAGYTFAGWYTGPNGAGSQVTADTAVTTREEHNLYAKWEVNDYTVTFNPNGGTVNTTSKTVTFNNIYGELPTPQKAGYTFKGWVLGNAEYEPIEYIESTGKQIINTGYKPGPNTGVEITYQMTDLTGQQRIFSSFGKDAIQESVSYHFFVSGGQKWSYAHSNGTGNWTASGIDADTSKHTLKFNVENNLWSMDDGIQIELQGNVTNTSINNLFVMGWCTTIDGEEISGYFAKMKLYSFKIYENGELVRDFIPSIRTSDVMPGLYDRLSETFYTNSGEGTFTIPSFEYKTSETIVTTASHHTLVAQWEEDLSNIKYLGNGGTNIQSANLIAKYDGTYNAGSAHDGTTTIWTDSSGNGRDGIITDGTWGADYLQFNGSSTWVNLGEINSDDITIETTFSLDSFPTSGTYNIIGNLNIGGINIVIDSGHRACIFYYVNGVAEYEPLVQTIELNKTYHIAMTRSGNRIRGYLDGKLSFNTDIEGAINNPSNSTVMAIGANSVGSTAQNSFLSGKIYNVAIYNTALSTEQIALDVGKKLQYGVEYGELPTPERAGYTFGGWYTGANGTGTQVTAETIVSTRAEHNLYAKWVPNNYDITWLSGNLVEYIELEGYRTGSYAHNGDTYEISKANNELYSGIYMTADIFEVQRIYILTYKFRKTDGTLLNIGGHAKNVIQTSFTVDGVAGGNYDQPTVNVSDDNNVHTVMYEFTSAEGINANYDSDIYIQPNRYTTDYVAVEIWDVELYEKVLIQTKACGSTIDELPVRNRTNYTLAGWFTEKKSGTQVTTATTVPPNDVTYYTHWNPDTTTVTFNANGGSVAQTSKTIAFNSPYGELPIPTRVGYTFAGWYTGENATGTQVTANTIVSKMNEHTLYAKWQANSYNLVKVSSKNLIENGEFETYSLIDAQTTTANGVTHTWDKSLNGVPGNTSKTYYPSYWSTGYNPGVAVPEIGYHAHMKIVNGNAVFDFKTNEAYSGKTKADLSDKITVGADSTVSQNRWLGTNQYVYKEFTPGNTYTITMDVYRVSGSSAITSGLAYATGTSTTRTFPSGRGTFSPSTTGQWKTISWTFTLDSNYNSSVTPILYVYGYENGNAGELYVDNVRLNESTTSSKVYDTTYTSSELQNPARTGYTFNGWHNNASYTTVLSTSNTFNSSTATFEQISTLGTCAYIYEKTTVNNYTVYLDANEGTIPATTGWTISTNGDSKVSAKKSVTYDSTYGTLPTPTRTGYTFAGWWSGTTVGNVSIPAGTGAWRYGDVAYNIQPGVTYTIQLNAALTSGTATQFSTVIYDFTSSTNLGQVQTAFGNNKTITVTCPATADETHKLRLLLYAGVAGSTANNAVSFSNIKIGTTGSSTGTQYSASSTVDVASNHQLYALWTAGTYTVSYNANGGTGAPSAQTKTHNVNLTITSTKPTKSNSTGTITITYNANGGNCSTNSATSTKTTTYTFRNWNTLANGSGTAYSSGGSYTANASATLYAQWNSSSSATSVTLPTPTASGYTFYGWYTASSGGTKVGDAGSSYTPTAGITLYAHWSPNTYTITLNNGSATTNGTSAIYEEVNRNIYLDSAKTKAMTTSANPITIPQRKYTVTYNANGGSCGTSSAVATYTFNGYYDGSTQMINASGYRTSNLTTTKYTAAKTLTASWTSSAVTLPTPTRANYIFNGWYTASSGGTRVGSAGASYTPTTGITLYAQWTPIITITLNNGSATTNGTSAIYEVYNSNIYLDSARTRAMTTSANPITKPQRKYTVTYNANGGSCSTSSATATYTFSGYYDGSTQMISGAGYRTSTLTVNKYTSAKTLTASWSGGSVTLPTPTRTGYTFKGWSTSSTASSGSTGSYTPTSNVTLYATWQVNAITNASVTGTTLLRGWSATLAHSYGGTAKTKTFSSSNTNIATVTNAGVVTASSTNTGSATITMTLTDYAGTVTTKTCTVTVNKGIARIGTKDYATLQAAVATVAASGTATVQLLQNHTLTSALTVDSSKNITLSLGGYTLNTNGTSVVNANNATLTLTNGTITNISTGGYSTIYGRNNAIININSGVIINHTNTDSDIVQYGVYIDKATVNANGGTIKGSNAGIGTAYNGNNNVINVTGGTVEGTYGIGIYAWGATVSITGGTITGTEGIALYGGTLTVNSNSAVIAGTGREIDKKGSKSAGILASNKSNITIKDGTIKSDYGSGIYCDGSTLNLQGGRVTGRWYDIYLTGIYSFHSSGGTAHWIYYG